MDRGTHPASDQLYSLKAFHGIGFIAVTVTATNKNTKTAVLSLEFCSLYVDTAKLRCCYWETLACTYKCLSWDLGPTEMRFIETDVQHVAPKETPMACNEEEAVWPSGVREQMPQFWTAQCQTLTGWWRFLGPRFENVRKHQVKETNNPERRKQRSRLAFKRAFIHNYRTGSGCRVFTLSLECVSTIQTW